MKFLVRYAVDGCLHDEAEISLEADGIRDAHLGPLVDCIKLRGLQKAAPSAILLPTTPITVSRGGRNSWYVYPVCGHIAANQSFLQHRHWS